MIECGKPVMYRVAIEGKQYPQSAFFCHEHLEKARQLAKLYRWQLVVDQDIEEILNRVCKVLIYSGKERL